MKIRPYLLPILLICLSSAFFEKAFQASEQLQLRWRFAGLMFLTGCVIVSLAFFTWRHVHLQAAWYSRRLQMIFLIVGLVITAGATLLPQRMVDYVSAREPDSVSVLTEPLKLQPGEVINLPLGEKTLLDWLKDFSSPDIQQYQGKTIDVTGFVVYSSRTSLGQFTINRMTLTCCIPDPVPVGLPVEWQPGTHLAENTWIEVKGTINIVNVNGTDSPEILAQQVDIIDKPKQPYLFPK
jgi:uncharacterized repeat protein (TIGR03943 family)